MHKNASTIKRGSIILVPFPFTDLSSAKVRPALVISSENTDKADVVAAFISSVVSKTKNADDIHLNKNDGTFMQTGLKTSSIVRCRKIASLDRSIILGEIGHLDADTMKRFDKTLARVLGI